MFEQRALLTDLCWNVWSMKQWWRLDLETSPTEEELGCCNFLMIANEFSIFCKFCNFWKLQYDVKPSNDVRSNRSAQHYSSQTPARLGVSSGSAAASWKADHVSRSELGMPSSPADSLPFCSSYNKAGAHRFTFAVHFVTGFRNNLMRYLLGIWLKLS